MHAVAFHHVIVNLLIFIEPSNCVKMLWPIYSVYDGTDNKYLAGLLKGNIVDNKMVTDRAVAEHIRVQLYTSFVN
jgi:hypothetical protein